MVLKLRLLHAHVLRLPGPLGRIGIDLKAFLHTAGLGHDQGPILVVHPGRAPQGPGPPGASLIGRCVPKVLIDQHRVEHVPLADGGVIGAIVVMLLDAGDIPKGLVHSPKISALGTGPALRGGKTRITCCPGAVLIKPDGVPGIQGLHSGLHRRRVHRNAIGHASALALRGLHQLGKGQVLPLQVLLDLLPDPVHGGQFLRQILPGVQRQNIAQGKHSFLICRQSFRPWPMGSLCLPRGPDHSPG